MGVVAGADEAGQTPQAPDRAQQTADQVQPAAEQIPAQEQPAGEQTAQAPEQTSQEPEPATEQAPEQTPQAPGFGERGRMRRRARFLRKARELAYRDLGGLVFDLHRFGQRNDQLVLAKLATLRQIDTELRELEEVLRDRRPVTVLREVGIAACPRCAAIHGSDDRFCPGCGLAFDTNADRPISTAPVSQHAQAPAPTSQAPAAIQTPAAAPATPATAQLTSQLSPLPTPPSKPPAYEQASPSTLPKVERASQSAPPKVEPAPPVKPTAAPVAAKQAPPPASPTGAPVRREPDRAEEDEPTQILRPPARGA